ncbi:MAG: hypothetical protein A3G52_04740 [Candidatus Taylorbacteria bacterium RIFCSPLOWO2_12_FULL_43_20]|uniref:Large ribosomal subunit protein uL15 n=1 Tax=Candidatus Taylorbacteria bacterium RIFCSPLOWO2_12_FULL_43_20 TaxID=1802332 RepID=A0A1G2P2B0_9BACT|nr:MAG: hypothetical protein A2825_02730 [Candidatus Taylorbacteria bacterium RIFCSPHIGHO2_01_FULL_43_120]OHA23462.1 MAG: hypothetical protein A3B98_01285 [Candidatus Taylorbacteria bacterium RIFCSPHIGHO2_02_FULL_43_55]OHA29667.1 MAG: hypothetical protein A3E92_03590 [Candidatus Taylorbacteria bacterium RIFCSPHIGHO2_12_FULL_42_34]OHA31595.1 MAG: hypothetical protein A3B09_02685 [Candidatus Taylorbacteria bacterium RIFCSPLOWO2_01_FULL_43_83]OHA38976.1 MAG: hypothetical protein A3H58_00820 [Candi
MQLHNVKRNTKRKKKIRVGRGGKRGKTSGRGTKGQNARAGRKKRPELRDLIKKLPKLRGRGVNSNKSRQADLLVVNLDFIEKNFQNGSEVSPKTLETKGVVRRYGNSSVPVKILSMGNLTKSITVIGCELSKKAKDAVEKAGGKIV